MDQNLNGLSGGGLELKLLDKGWNKTRIVCQVVDQNWNCPSSDGLKQNCVTGGGTKLKLYVRWWTTTKTVCQVEYKN